MSDNSQLSSPAGIAWAVTPNDSNDMQQMSRALYVGTGGDVSVVTKGGYAVTFKNVLSGHILPVQCWRVCATDTTAQDIVALG